MAEEVISGSGSSGREGEINIRVGLTSRDSLDSRWVFPGEDDSEIEDNGDGDDDLPHRAAVDSEGEDNQEHRLIRTEPRVDSFDVEALEVHGAHRSDYEDLGIARRIIHAFQTLGVVFGDVGTSPLYTFSVMFSKAPIKGDEDVIGALSLVLYTLLLVPLVKYVLIVLWANDDGEGSEAMFADLCYFSVRSIQLTFVFLVLPCLLLGYLGQAAYLTGNLNGAEKHPFFLSIPSGIFWPVLLIANIAALIASRAMTTATFSCIKQSSNLGCLVLVCSMSSINEIGNAYGIAELGVMMMTTILVTIVMLLIWRLNIIIVLSFVVFFLGLELTFFSSVLWSVTDGSWVILVFAVIMFVIMYIWNYGSKLKYETEVERKLPMDLMREIGCNLGTIRAPGIGLLYNELAKGVPAIFGHFITTLPAIHSMVVFVCIKYVPVPVVPQNERFFFRRVCPKSYHLFRCIARYGYKDVRKENHQAFEQLLIESLEKLIRREAQQRQLESDGDEDADSEEDTSFSRVLIDPNGSVYSLGVPLLAEFRGSSNSISEASISEELNPNSPASPSISDAEHSLERELSFIRQAKESGVVYLLGHGDIRARKDSWFIKKLLAGTSMVIADGVVTPAMSVMSAVGGLKVGVAAIEQGIGIYNLIKYDASVLRAFNPVHIYLYFKRNSVNAWYALGGCLLCATAKESGVVYLLGHGDIRARKDSWFIKKLVINYFYASLRKNCRRGIANLSVPHSHLIQGGVVKKGRRSNSMLQEMQIHHCVEQSWALESANFSIMYPF
ncbi:hypothetical protein GOBAR_DD09385 [Gossypium barbadense]|nr:hypothetical protein GOBAR_DD09385 [Gossypium barbadense]